jgi:signal transduction histidine kinase
LMPPDRWGEDAHILGRILTGERIECFETIRQGKNGKPIEISLTVSPIKDAGGKVTGVSKIVRDIAAQKKAERELARAHAEVVEASRAKDDFLAALSHELRTPLNPVLLLASDAAEDPGLAPEIRSKFSTIRTNVELEARLIDDLLDITRISHGKLTLDVATADVHAILKAALETVQAEFVQKKIELTLRLDEKKPEVKGDAMRLQQVFWNILKNAVKFTPVGGQVQVVTEISTENDQIRVHITDTGIGLTPPELHSIFNAFSQGEHANKGSSHRFGGLGLGLSISRMLVELHSGRLQASSEGRDQGATFTVELPLLTRNESEPAAASPHNGHAGNFESARSALLGIRILLVEDHEPTRVALTQLLSRRKHDVLPAVSLSEARSIARQEKLDLVISDIGLPDGDGYTLMAELRENFGLKGIALTGYGMEQDIVRGKNAGFIGHLVKPIRMERLDEILRLVGLG